jgi:prepilin-type N-terminal cleavage/methylation domain-containing protein
LKQNKGFTLIELMIVVAIIAILAAIAIPNFLSFVSKTRASEVQSNLAAIYKAELSFFGEMNRFSDSFVEIRWVPEGMAYYTYSVGTEYFGKDNDVNPKPASAAPAANDNSFAAYGWGNIDSDSVVDIWHIDQLKNMVHDVYDITS